MKVLPMKLRLIPVVAVLALTLAACTDATSPIPTAVAVAATAGLPLLPKNAYGFIDLSAAQLANAMPAKNFTLVNVHVPDQGNLPGTDLSIPYDQIVANVGKLPAKDAPIVLYCRSGGMSTQAAAQLAAAGYSRIYELDGGFNAWKSTGHALASR